MASAPKKRFFSWRLKLILLCGALLGAGVGLFAEYVARIDASPNGTTPMSWQFKARSRSVPEFFKVEEKVGIISSSPIAALPAIDRAVPAETESALFALG